MIQPYDYSNPDKNKVPPASKYLPGTSLTPYNYPTVSKAQQLQAEADQQWNNIPQASQLGFRDIPHVIKNIPSAAGQVASEMIGHPLQTGRSIVGGLLDVGPTIVNSLRSIFGIKAKLPLPGQTMNDYIGNNSEVQKTISGAATQIGGYELGNAAVGAAGATGAAKTILGNVVGGQAVAEGDLKDRMKQAVFDATFGVAQVAGGKILGAIRGGETPAGAPNTPTHATPEPRIKYEIRPNLGTNPRGEKILARTEVDSRTGNAIIYYTKDLEANPALKQRTLDHELGHVMDKRVNGGTNLSAELPNYTGNKLNLDNTLGNFAKSQGKDVQTVVKELQDDVTALSGGQGNPGENFADAVAQYRANPSGAQDIAPTFHAFMEYSPITKAPEPVISSRVTTESTLPKDLQPLNKVVGEAAPRAPKVESSPFASTGFKTGKTVQTESFNPKSINAPEEVESLMKDIADQNKEFASQRVSKGNQDIKDLARITGLTEEQLIKAKPGSIANAETVTAARQLVIDKASELQNWLKGVDISAATPEQLAEFKQRLGRLVSMQKAVAGLRTEASNVFRSLGLEVVPGENATLKEMASLLKEQGLEGDAALFAEKVGKTMQLSTLRRIGEGALSTWYAAILSGPKTTIRNLLSTSSNILSELASKAANPRQWSEIPASVSGLLRGLKQGIGEAKDVLSGGPASTKFLETSAGAKPEIFTGKWAGYGKIVESVGRFLNAQDKLLSAGAREMEAASLKVRSPEISDEVMKAVSRAYAESTVYHGTPKGKIIGGLRDAAQVLRTKVPEAKIIIPFVDTVANVLDRQFDYIPVFSALRLTESNLGRQADDIIKNFGLSATDRPFLIQRLRDQQIGRMVLGTAVSGAAVALAAEGRISGSGPTNVDEKNQLERTGWRPNSIKVGDTWVPYTYLGPLAGILSMAGNVYDKTHYDNAPNKTITDLLAKGLVGWSQTQLDASFLSGTADLLDVATGNLAPDLYFRRLLTGLVPVPALYSQTKDMVFQQQYETHSIVEAIRQKLGLTGDVFGQNPLQPRLDAFGEPVTSDLIYGITPSREAGDAVDNFLVANDLVVTKPRPNQEYTIPGTKEKRRLTEEEYTQFVKESGKRIYTDIQNKIPFLENLPAEKQKAELEKITTRERELARLKVMAGKTSPK